MKGSKKIRTLFALNEQDKQCLTGGMYKAEADIVRKSRSAENRHNGYESDVVRENTYKTDVSIQPSPISGMNITLSPDNFVFDGKEKRPEVIIRNGTKLLKAGIDYTVSYSNNVNAGRGSADIRGIGKKYTGSVSVPFDIRPKTISDNMVCLSQTDFTYDLRDHTPAVTVTDGNVRLNINTDYLVSYENNTEPGTAAAVIQGRGNYTGIVRKTFIIKPLQPAAKPAVQIITENVPDSPGQKPAAPPENPKGRGGRALFAVCMAALCVAAVVGVAAAVGVIFALQNRNKDVSVTSSAEISDTSYKEESPSKVSEISETSSVSSEAGQSSADKTKASENTVENTSVPEKSGKESSVPETTETESSADKPVTRESSVRESSVYVSYEESSERSAAPAPKPEPQPDPHGGVSQIGAETDIRELSSLALVSAPAKKQYRTGEKLDLTGMILEAAYTDGTKERLTGDDCVISGFDSSSPGTKTVKISYGGKSVTMSLEVAGDAPEQKPVTGKCGDSLSYTFSEGTLTISGTGDMYDSFPFADDMTVEKVVVGSGVTCIGEKAFSHCTQLSEAELADTVTEIKGNAFAECTSLKEVKLPASLTRIDYCAFSNCTSLSTVTIPDGVTDIEDNAFSGCVSLEKIVIPDSVTYIDPTAFDYCGEVTIYCRAGSAAEEFAKENGINHSAI